MKTSKLTEDQQKFWDLLRWPYKKGCFNCVWNTTTCVHPTRESYTPNDGCDPMFKYTDLLEYQQHFWKWDGETI